MNVFDLVAKLTLDSSSYESGLGDAKKKAEGIGSKLGSALGAASKVAGAAITAASGAVVAFGKSAVDAGASFDSSMSQVAATMGKTVDEISDLRQFAMDMGATTSFSASQAADALNYMALAGYDAQTSMTMLPNVLNLAAAGGIELARASDMVTDAQSALGITLDETALLVDKMAKASSKSNTSVAQLGDAILTVGGTAKNLSGGTTELAQSLGILADNGIKGSEGGTALRNIILSLSAPTDAAAAAIKSLGVSVFDAKGNMRPLSQLFTEMESGLGKLSQKDRTEVLSKIFNKVDLKSANALLATSVDRWDELAVAIDDSVGAAQQMAGTQLDNLSGDVTIFQSALEGAKIAISDRLTPSLRKFVKFGTEGLTKIADAFKADGIQGAAEALGDVLSNGITKIVNDTDKVVDAGIRIVDALLSGIEKNAGKLTSGAVKLVTTLGDGLMRLSPKLLRVGIELTVSLFKSIAQEAPNHTQDVIAVVLEIVGILTNPQQLDMIIDSALQIIAALAEGLITAPGLADKVPQIIVTIVETLARNFDKILKAGADVLLKLIDGIFSNRDKIEEAGREIISVLISAAVSVFASLVNLGGEIVGKIWDGLKSAWENDVAPWFNRVWSNLVAGKNLFAALTSGTTVNAEGFSSTSGKFDHGRKIVDVEGNRVYPEYQRAQGSTGDYNYFDKLTGINQTINVQVDGRTIAKATNTVNRNHAVAMAN